LNYPLLGVNFLLQKDDSVHEEISIAFKLGGERESIPSKNPLQPPRFENQKKRKKGWGGELTTCYRERGIQLGVHGTRKKNSRVSPVGGGEKKNA